MKTYIVTCGSRQWTINSSSPKSAAQRILREPEVKSEHVAGGVQFVIRVQEAKA